VLSYHLQDDQTKKARTDKPLVAEAAALAGIRDDAATGGGGSFPFWVLCGIFFFFLFFFFFFFF
jgi:hypothetical protein